MVLWYLPCYEVTESLTSGRAEWYIQSFGGLRSDRDGFRWIGEGGLIYRQKEEEEEEEEEGHTDRQKEES